MYDPIIRELFPENAPVFNNRVVNSLNKDCAQDFSLMHGAVESGPNYFNGDYDLSYSTLHYIKTFFPSSLARSAFLFLQTAASASFSCQSALPPSRI